MTRYLETFFRYRGRLLAPLLLAVVIAPGIVLAQPRTYSASAKIWVDSPKLQTGSANDAYQNPSEQEAALIKEFLNTRAFSVKVGHAGPLAAAVQRRGTHQSFLAGLLATVQGTAPGGPDDAVFTALSTQTSVSTGGPQVVSIKFSDADPLVAAGTVKALISQLGNEIIDGQRSKYRSDLLLVAAQLKRYDDQVALADGKVRDYLALHPEIRNNPLTTDARLTDLRRDYEGAVSSRDATQLKADDLRLKIENIDGPGAQGFHIIDPPTVPSRPTSIRTGLIQAVLGGLLVGLIVLVLATVALTAGDPSLRSVEDAKARLPQGLVLGEVPWLDRRTLRRRTAKPVTKARLESAG